MIIRETFCYCAKRYVYPCKLPNEVCLKFGFVDGQQASSVYNAMLMSDSKIKTLMGYLNG
jgi:hypothetical protein